MMLFYENIELFSIVFFLRVRKKRENNAGKQRGEHVPKTLKKRENNVLKTVKKTRKKHSKIEKNTVARHFSIRTFDDRRPGGVQGPGKEQPPSFD